MPTLSYMLDSLESGVLEFVDTESQDDWWTDAERDRFGRLAVGLIMVHQFEDPAEGMSVKDNSGVLAALRNGELSLLGLDANGEPFIPGLLLAS